MTNLVSVVFECDPPPARLLPGYLVRGWLLRVIARQARALAALLHDGTAALPVEVPEEAEARRRRPVPFTVSPCYPRSNARGEVATVECGWFRVTSLWNDLTQVLLGLHPSECPELVLGGFRATVTRLVVDASDHPLALQTTAGDMAAWAMTMPDGRPVTRLVFDSPTLFSAGRGHGHTLFPVPALVFDSLATAWSAYSGIPLEPVRVAELLEAVRVRAFDLRTTTMAGPRPSETPAPTRHANEPGFIGWAEFGLDPSAPRELARLLAMLASFSMFSGVGARTTHGFGQALAVDTP